MVSNHTSLKKPSSNSPELSFAVRHFVSMTIAGIMVTASHNPERIQRLQKYMVKTDGEMTTSRFAFAALTDYIRDIENPFCC